MTELTFLLELLLNHKLPAATKKVVHDRIKEVEVTFMSRPINNVNPAPAPKPLPPHIAMQAPSTQRLMLKHEALEGATAMPEELPAPPPVEPVAVIAQTPATVAALNSRQEALAGKLNPATGRPRKF